MVSFNYVSSPKLVLSRKVLLMSAACVSKFPFFEAFQPNSTWDHFMRHPVQQIVYKRCSLYTCQNWISMPNIMLNHLQIHSRSDFPDAINSIRRSATTASGNVAKPMTSVFCDVIRLESIRGRSNVLIEGHFWQFLGNLNPKMLSAIMWTPKGTSLRQNACFETSCVKFHARVTSVGESGE